MVLGRDSPGPFEKEFMNTKEKLEIILGPLTNVAWGGLVGSGVGSGSEDLWDAYDGTVADSKILEIMGLTCFEYTHETAEDVLDRIIGKNGASVCTVSLNLYKSVLAGVYIRCGHCGGMWTTRSKRVLELRVNEGCAVFLCPFCEEIILETNAECFKNVHSYQE